MTPSIRLQTANAFLCVIASCGKRFFNYRGSIYTMPDVAFYWNEAHGGILKPFLVALANHITTGATIPESMFTSWGYDAPSLALVIQTERALGIIEAV